MKNLEVDEQARGGQDHQAEDDRLGGCRPDVADENFQVGHRRRQYLVDGSGVLGHVDAEGGIGNALGKQRQHDQARHDKGAVADAMHLGHARADGRAEHHEVQRRGDHRRGDALQQGAPGARQFEQVDGADCVEIHARDSFTRFTKMSSSELWLDCRSLKSMPCCANSLSNSAMPVCSRWASKVNTRTWPASANSSE
ncbi:hypothetical protein D9M68_531820 [compost metagenome]